MMLVVKSHHTRETTGEHKRLIITIKGTWRHYKKLKPFSWKKQSKSYLLTTARKQLLLWTCFVHILDHISFVSNFSRTMHRQQRRVLPAIIIAIIVVAVLGGIAYWWLGSQKHAYDTTAIVTNGIECAEITRYVWAAWRQIIFINWNKTFPINFRDVAKLWRMAAQ